MILDSVTNSDNTMLCAGPGAGAAGPDTTSTKINSNEDEYTFYMAGIGQQLGKILFLWLYQKICN